MSLLLRRWEQATAGDGQVVLLNGEAGIGKSRLVQVLKERIAREEHARVEYRSSPYYQNSALYPMIDHLQRLLQFSREDAPEEKLHKLEAGVRRGRSSQPDIIAHQNVNISEAGTVGDPHPTGEAEAEVCFLKAIEIARKQQAKSLELRAVMSLSRLWQLQGKRAEAQQILAEIYGWFTEGFDTKDLQEAKALLEELSS